MRKRKEYSFITDLCRRLKEGLEGRTSKDGKDRVTSALPATSSKSLGLRLVLPAGVEATQMLWVRLCAPQLGANNRQERSRAVERVRSWARAALAQLQIVGEMAKFELGTHHSSVSLARECSSTA